MQTVCIVAENIKIKSEFDISPLISKRIEYLEKMEDYIEKKIEKMPEGDISVYKGHSPNSFRYYLRKSGKEKHGEYLGKANCELRDELAQKKYYEVLLKQIKSEYSKLIKIQTMGIDCMSGYNYTCDYALHKVLLFEVECNRKF